MTRGRRATTVLLTALAFALGAAGCGGDDDEGDTTSPFEISAPEATVQTEATAPAETAPQTTTSEGGGTGGTSPPSSNPGKQDSATNDTSPPAGSPQEAFEKECEQNPAACG